MGYLAIISEQAFRKIRHNEYGGLATINPKTMDYEQYNKNKAVYIFNDIESAERVYKYLKRKGKKVGTVVIEINGGHIERYTRARIDKPVSAKYIILHDIESINYNISEYKPQRDNRAGHLKQKTIQVNQPSIQNKVQSQPVQYNQGGQQSINNQQTNNKDKDFGVLSGIRINIDIAILFFIAGCIIHGVVHGILYGFKICCIITIALILLTIAVIIVIKYKK